MSSSNSSADEFDEDNTSRITISGTTDVDSGDTLTYSVVTGPSNGTLGGWGVGTASDGSALSGNQNLYTPDADWAQSASGVYRF